MKKLALVIAIFAAHTAWSYQVTGPVLEVTDTKIVVQKGKEKWEIARTPGTKTSAEVKVGDKVTVEYTMSATDIETKSAKSKK